jgi:hypothetical protein
MASLKKRFADVQSFACFVPTLLVSSLALTEASDGLEVVYVVRDDVPPVILG